MASTLGNHGRTEAWTGPDRRIATTNGAGADVVAIERVGANMFRYGLSLVFMWIGLLKFTVYEAKNIEPLVMNSPIWAWAHQSLGLQNLSFSIGVIEVSVGVLIALRNVWPKASAVGSAGAVITFLITLSFMLTTPGVWEPGYGFPALSALPGQFLAKDLVLLGVSIWTAAEAWRAGTSRRRLPGAHRR